MTDNRNDRDVVYTEVQPVPQPTSVVVDRPSRTPAFITGIIVALVLAVMGVIVFLAVSDSDDDGNIDVNVPAVDVETDTGG